jgi:exosome complex component RRP46
MGQGKTLVLAAVHGPGDVDARRELPDRATLAVTVTPLSGQDGPVERQREELLRGVLAGAVMAKLHPRTLIHVVVQVLCDDGALLAVAVNAAVAALVEAGVPMRTLVTAACCALLPDGDDSGDGSNSTRIVLDPTLAEQRMARAVVTLALDSEGGLVMSHTTGPLSPHEFSAAAASCKLACDTIAKFFRVAVTQQYTPGPVPME